MKVEEKYIPTIFGVGGLIKWKYKYLLYSQGIWQWVLKKFTGMILKGLAHQIINAWKWYQSEVLGLDMLLQILKKHYLSL